MTRNFYTIKVTEDNQEKEENIGIGYGIELEGIRCCNPIIEWGLDNDCIQNVLKEISDGEKEIVFDIEAGEWVRVNSKDMLQILKEVNKIEINHLIEKNIICPYCDYNDFNFIPVSKTKYQICKCKKCGKFFVTLLTE